MKNVPTVHDIRMLAANREKDAEDARQANRVRFQALFEGLLVAQDDPEITTINEFLQGERWGTFKELLDTTGKKNALRIATLNENNDAYFLSGAGLVIQIMDTGMHGPTCFYADEEPQHKIDMLRLAVERCRSRGKAFVAKAEEWITKIYNEFYTPPPTPPAE